MLSIDSVDEYDSLMELIDEYYNNSKVNQYMPNYRETLLSDLVELINEGGHDGVGDDDELKDIIDSYFYLNDIPDYSNQYYEKDECCAKVGGGDDIKLDATIQRLIEYPYVEQRTMAWYEMRYQMMSASNIYKAFKSPATMASLMKEKTAPMETFGMTATVGGSGESMGTNAGANINSSMGWGVIFEQVSLQIYEYINETKVGIFGCIKHPQWDFIGASPDGINIQKGNPKYGKMLEIKNIFNRDITGIPKDEYWVQMQLQMEVCDLAECDFLETRFKTYNTREELVADTEQTFKGVLLQMVDGSYKYLYGWEFTDNDEMFMMVDLFINKQQSFNVWYWYLDEWSCVLVKRNREWFNAILPQLIQVWDNILQARKTYTKPHHVCLIKLTGDDDDTN